MQRLMSNKWSMGASAPWVIFDNFGEQLHGSLGVSHAYDTGRCKDWLASHEPMRAGAFINKPTIVWDGLCNAATRTAPTGSVHGWTHLLHGQSRRAPTGVFRQGSALAVSNACTIPSCSWSTAMVSGGPQPASSSNWTRAGSSKLLPTHHGRCCCFGGRMLGSTLTCNSKNVRQASWHGYFRETLELDVVYGSLSWSFNIHCQQRTGMAFWRNEAREVNPRPGAWQPLLHLFYIVLPSTDGTVLLLDIVADAQWSVLHRRQPPNVLLWSGFTATWYGVMSPRWTATWVITSTWKGHCWLQAASVLLRSSHGERLPASRARSALSSK